MLPFYSKTVVEGILEAHTSRHIQLYTGQACLLHLIFQVCFALICSSKHPSQMNGFTKDTLFNDLPQAVKQKIISIRNLSFPSGKLTSSASLKDFDHIAVPSSKNLSSTFLRMATSFPSIGKGFDATESLRKEVDEFSEFVGLYRMETNDIDFIVELDKTIGLMESRYEKLLKGLNMS